MRLEDPKPVPDLSTEPEPDRAPQATVEAGICTPIQSPIFSEQLSLF